MAWIQAVAPGRYGSLGEAQRLRTVTLPAERGSIFDRNGNELAMSVRQYTVWADPRLVARPAKAANALAPVLGLDAAVLRSRLQQNGAFVYLARQVPDEVAAKVEQLELPGVSLLEESKRFRPSGDVARSVLGSVDIDNIGLSGLELQFDDLLSGTPGELLLERAPDGSTIAAGRRRVTPASRGADLVLTVDRALQYEAERALAEQVAATNANGGMVIVMRPQTGEILAMANVIAGGEGQPPRPSRHNMAATTVFEPGSVNKVVTLAGALEERLFGPDDVLQVPDKLRVSVHTFSDHDAHPTMPMTVTDILKDSSNIGTIMIAKELAKERVDRYLRAFGFGSLTGSEFPGESPGLLLDLDGWTGTSIGSVPIGQGIGVTSLQVLGMVNAIANRGVRVEPTMVRAVVDPDGSERPADPPGRRRVVSERTAHTMNRMLTTVVESGTGTAARIDGYTVAGKTGTARKPSETMRGYEPGAYMATFAGYVPAENPQLSAIVVLDEPHPFYGGLVAAPVFTDIARYALQLLRLPPASPEPLAVEEQAPVNTPSTLVGGSPPPD